MKYLTSIAILLILLPSLCTAQVKSKRPANGQRVDARFLYAIEKADLATFYSLLKRGANVNARRENRTSALMVAALNGQTLFLVALLSKGAYVNARNTFGNTALMDAASFGQVEMVRWLLIAGADVNARNESGWSALMLTTKSAYAQQPNYQSVIELLKAAEKKKR